MNIVYRFFYIILCFFSFCSINQVFAERSKLDSHSFTKHFYVKAYEAFVSHKRLKANCLGCVYGSEKPRQALATNLVFGMNINKYFSTELAARYSRLKYKHAPDTEKNSQNSHMLAAFVNLYAKYPVHNRVSLYGAPGVGVASNHSNNFRVTNIAPLNDYANKGTTNSSIVWNVGAGMLYKTSKKVSLDVGYKYLYLGKIGKKVGLLSSKKESHKIYGHEILLGVIYNL